MTAAARLRAAGKNPARRGRAAAILISGPRFSRFVNDMKRIVAYGADDGAARDGSVKEDEVGRRF
uniref:Uncharacterized protein n=1 Tax=Desulfovibrio sp. U5L TaxID=596152 RepID=I2Q2B6_9BACT